MGEQVAHNRGLRILNELLQQFVDETNARKGAQRSAFVVWNGDLVWAALPDAFANFVRIVRELTVPSVLVHGNHDGKKTDSQFLQVQQQLSGYQRLNYSFDYGRWHFIVIASQPKYPDQADKARLLQWLEHELKTHRDQPVMLFMHYHLLPVGLSQMEYYTYTPAKFRQQMLDLVTRYGNVRYVFSGHVHSGIKSSIKASKEYKGTKFVVVPTPVFQRPFGEEYPEFADPGRYDKRGFYLEVHVDGEHVRLVGRKIGRPVTKEFPKHFPHYTPEMDPRHLVPESRLPANTELLNGGFTQGMAGWHTSWRYQRDQSPMFINRSMAGKNLLQQTAGYGAWNFDEYQESFQLVTWKAGQPHNLDYFLTPKRFSKQGAGGYVRVFSYLKSGDLGPLLLVHWGERENSAKDMIRSWAYNATGRRHGPLWLDKKLKQGTLASYRLPVRIKKENHIAIALNQLFAQVLGESGLDQIDHIGIAHGVWTRITPQGTPIRAVMAVDAVRLSHEPADKPAYPLMLNNQPVKTEWRDQESVPYSEHYRKLIQKRRKKRLQSDIKPRQKKAPQLPLRQPPQSKEKPVICSRNMECDI